MKGGDTMNCTPQKHVFLSHGGHGGCCHHGGHGPGHHFMSKKKKIEMLKKHIDMLNEKIEDIQEYIKELEGK
jgi:hypothetical protein